MNAIRAIDRPIASAPRAARLMLGLLERLRVGSLVLTTPEGETVRFIGQTEGTRAELVVRDWAACRHILWSGDIGFAEAYRDGLVDSSDLTALLRLAIENESVLDRALFGGTLSIAWHWLRHRLRPNDRAGSRRNIHAHYDLGNEFYGLWLDPGFSYSSALFEGDAGRTLEQAQEAKYARLVETLGLRPGMRVLEIGCGWGGFAEHAARRGIHVHGITISAAQLEYAKRRTAALPGITLEMRDYRDVRGEYDAVVSIEMFEAVGERYWPTFFDAVRDRLRTGCRAAVQTITIDERRYARYRAGSDFIQQFIFPGGMLPSPERFAAGALGAGLATVGTFGFGPDYAETLRRWRAPFEARLDAVRALGFDDAFIRIWRLYLCYCEAAFDSSRISVMQTCLERQR